MLNALPTPTTATGLQANLLPNLAAEPHGQRAATEARQGFAALMQQQADLRSADLRAADLKLAAPSSARPRTTDTQAAPPATPRAATANREARAPRHEPAKTAAPSGATGAAKPAERAAEKSAHSTEPAKATPAAGQVQEPHETHSVGTETTDAAAPDNAVDMATAEGRPVDSTTLTDAAADQALADAVASTAALPTALLRGRSPGQPGAAAGDELPLHRLPRTTATEATAAAARLATALAPKVSAETTDVLVSDTLPSDGDAAGPATAEADATLLSPDPATLQPWLQAQAMVTHWRPVGDDTMPSADNDPALAVIDDRGAQGAPALAVSEQGLLAQRQAGHRTADLRAAGVAAQALISQTDGAATDTPAEGLLPAADPAQTEAARAAAEETRHANTLRTPGSLDIGQRGRWRPEAETAATTLPSAPVEAEVAVGRPQAAAPDGAVPVNPALPTPPLQGLPSAPALQATGARDQVAAGAVPTTTAQVAVASSAATTARGLAEPATPGARIASDRSTLPRAERGATSRDGEGTTAQRASGTDAAAASAHQRVEAVADRSSPESAAGARADTALPANTKPAESIPGAGAAPTRASEGALPAQAGVQAPAQRGEATGRIEAVRAEALQAPAGNVPVPGSLAQPQGSAPTNQLNTTAFAPQLAAATAPPQAEARIAVPLNSPEFAPALGAQISVFTRDGVQTARLQLNPAEMGPITVQIALDGSAARVDFQADVAATREVIEASLPALAGALQDAGLTLAGGGVFQHAPGQQQQPEGQAPQPARGTAQGDNANAGLRAEAAAPVATRSRGLVDLIA